MPIFLLILLFLLIVLTFIAAMGEFGEGGSFFMAFAFIVVLPWLMVEWNNNAYRRGALDHSKDRVIINRLDDGNYYIRRKEGNDAPSPLREDDLMDWHKAMYDSLKARTQ